MIYTTVESSPIHYLPLSDKSSAFGIWGRVFGFYVEHWLDLLVILPLLFLPVFTDALHTLLIEQHIRQQALRMGGKKTVSGTVSPCPRTPVGLFPIFPR